MIFKSGDLVTRDGTDIHRITSASGDSDLIEAVCVKEPLGYLKPDMSRGRPWCLAGESNIFLADRLELVGHDESADVIYAPAPDDIANIV